MAVLNETELYEQELKRFQTDPIHYTTPGARRYYRRVVGGFVVLAASFVVGVWAMTNVLTDKLRHDINTYLVVSCTNSIPTLKKFNAKLDSDIEVQVSAKKLNLQQGDTARAAINDKAIKVAQESKLPVPTKKECKERGAF